MSSLRNAIPRRPHRERAQPHERRKWGLLEKHKDYSLRAQDFAAKKARLRVLRQKAGDANPDEFHFAMMSSRVDKDGVKVAERGNKPLSHDVVGLLKTQDKGYLKTMATKTAKERERLENAMSLLDGEVTVGQEVGEKPKKGSHTIFVNDGDAQKSFDAQEYFGTNEHGLQESYNRPKVEETEVEKKETKTGSGEMSKAQKKQVEKQARRALRQQQLEEQRRARQREKLWTRLEAIKTRERELRIAEQELDEQRAKMNNSMGGVNKNGVKFKIRERKR